MVDVGSDSGVLDAEAAKGTGIEILYQSRGVVIPNGGRERGEGGGDGGHRTKIGPVSGEADGIRGVDQASPVLMVEPEASSVASPVGIARVIFRGRADVDLLHVAPVEGGVGLKDKSGDTGDDGAGGGGSVEILGIIPVCVVACGCKRIITIIGRSVGCGGSLGTNSVSTRWGTNNN